MLRKNLKKGQGLPLNTIVIAIIVIIVLLVIIVFFTTKFSAQGDKIEDAGESATMCSSNNPLFESYGNNIGKIDKEGTCIIGGSKQIDADNWKRIPGTNCCYSSSSTASS